MALKGDRLEVVTDVSFFMNETAERGGIAVLSTAGSGAAMDQAAALVTYVVHTSGTVPVGMLMNDMVNVDQSKYRINVYKDEVQQGSKVTLMQEGWGVTNMIYPGITPTAGAYAFLAPSGRITTTAGPVDATGYTGIVGRFLSLADEDGYAKVYVKLPR